MGALHGVREKEARKKYALLEEQAAAAVQELEGEGEEGAGAGAGAEGHQMAPFHYGTHYTSAASVLHFMIRLQPFSAHAVAFQGGRRFDKPDRVFQSMQRSWLSASGGLTPHSHATDLRTGNLQDVKELIPEFYYLPEFLVNVNGYNFGENSDGRAVGDVELPPWAKGSPAEFIRLHRAALESPHVTARLHRWIDLIFGHRQRGPRAERACNVFGRLSYEGAVDADALSPEERAVCLQQIRDFGQIPAQIFQSAHPACHAAAKKSVQKSTTTTVTTATAGTATTTTTVTTIVDTAGSAAISAPAAGAGTGAPSEPVLHKLSGARAQCLSAGRALAALGPRDTRAHTHAPCGESGGSATGGEAGAAHSAPVLASVVPISVVYDPAPVEVKLNAKVEGTVNAAVAAEKTAAAAAAAAAVAAAAPATATAAQDLPPHDPSEPGPGNRKYAALCPPKSVFIPWYDVTMTSGGGGGSARVGSPGPAGVATGPGMEISCGILAAWGYADCSFNIFCATLDKRYQDKPNSSQSVAALSADWRHVRTVSYPGVSVSCAACSRSGRLLLTGHAGHPAVHKWRVYPAKPAKTHKRGPSDPSRASAPASASAPVPAPTLPVDCEIILVETIPCTSHIGAITDIALSVCNGIFVTSCGGGNVVLWDMSTLQQTRLFSVAQFVDRYLAVTDTVSGAGTGVGAETETGGDMCLAVETTTGYIYCNYGRDVVIFDVNGNVAGRACSADAVSGAACIRCLCPVSGMGALAAAGAGGGGGGGGGGDLSLSAERRLDFCSVLVGYSDGSVILWQADSIKNIRSSSAAKGEASSQPSVSPGCGAAELAVTARRALALPGGRAVQSLAVPQHRKHEVNNAKTKQQGIDVYIGALDGSVYVWELGF
jgi:WD40 repeat protein